MRNTNFLQGWSAIHFQETHGEEHLLVMLKGLYTDLAALTTFGEWLEDTGWTSALAEANAALVGIAEAFLKSSHIAHKVTASSLLKLMNEAYSQLTDFPDQATHIPTFEEWKREMEVAAPQFQYWSTTQPLNLLFSF